MAAVTKCWILCVFSLCFGSGSQAYHSAHEVAASEPLVFNELCAMKEDAGPCKAMKTHFLFDVDEARCRPFEYGGCGGNANNFQSIEACQEACVVAADKSPCHLDEAPGPCRGLVTRYYFNRGTRQCQQFYYGGCFGNANNFRSMAECQSKCQNPAKPTKEPVTEAAVPTNSSALSIKEEVIIQLQAAQETSAMQTTDFKAPNFCLLPAAEGPCQARERRFAYNPLTQKCNMFHYGGCGGNHNKFVNRRQCMKICMNVQHHRIRIKRKNAKMVLSDA